MTLAIHGMAGRIVVAVAFEDAIRAEGSYQALFITVIASEARFAPAFPGHRVAEGVGPGTIARKRTIFSKCTLRTNFRAG